MDNVETYYQTLCVCSRLINAQCNQAADKLYADWSILNAQAYETLADMRLELLLERTRIADILYGQLA
jgi:hypothetical protein